MNPIVAANVIAIRTKASLNEDFYNKCKVQCCSINLMGK